MFQLSEETPTHYIVKHPRGDVLKIAKSGLSSDMHQNIKKMAEGGKVASPPPPPPPKLDPDKTKDFEKGFKGFDEGGEVSESTPGQTAPPQPPVVVNVAPAQPQQAAQPAPSAPQAAVPAQSPTPNMPLPNGSVGQLEQGLRQEAQATNVLGQEKAGIYHQQAQDEQQYNELFNQSLAEEHAHIKKNIDDYQNQSIDFNRIWNNKSAPQKVLAGLGILVSGIGSGMTGQPNLALQVINGEIDRDIQGQMAESDKKKNAFTMYRDLYGDEQRGIQAQRLAMQSVVLAKLNEMLSKSMGPSATAQMLQKSPLVLDMQKKALDLAAEKAKYKMVTQLTNPQGQQQLTSQPGGKTTQLLQPATYTPTENNQENPSLNFGRTADVDSNKLKAYELAGVIPKEAMSAVTKEAQDYQESQTNKKFVLKDLVAMMNAVKENTKRQTPGISFDPLGLQKGQELIGDLRFELGKGISHMEPWGGELSRQFVSAKASAVNKINSFLTKRIGGEAAKNIEHQLPSRADNEQEMIAKIERIMQLYDTNTPTSTLERFNVLPKQ